MSRFPVKLIMVTPWNHKEGIARPQRKFKVLYLYLFFRGVRYGYKGIKYSFLFYQSALGPP